MVTGYIGFLHWLDVVVIILYIIASLVVGFYSICKTKNNIRSVFLAESAVTWWPVGMSLFASNIGANNFVGITGSGASSGLAVIMFEWNAIFLVILLAWVFLPVYISCGVYTMPEYLQRRFGGDRIRIYLSCVQLATYVFTTLAFDLYTGSIFLQQTLNLDTWICVLVFLSLTAVFSILGGLETVILTDAMAVVVMISGGFFLCILGFIQLGSYNNLVYKYNHAVPNTTLANPNTTCGYPREDAWHIFRDPWTADYPWLGTTLRTTLGSLWYWCANQVLVQRVLAAKNITHGKGGALLAGFLKLSPMFIMVLPGMISRALYPDEVACADPAVCQAVCQNPAGCSTIALPKLVVKLLPRGIRGLMVAAIIAAVVSSLTSVYNSSSTMFTLDLWLKIRPRSSNREVMIVSKIFLILLTVFTLLWIPILSKQQGGDIFKYAATVSGYLGAPTCAMFLLAIFWYGCNEAGAFWGMMLAQAWGLVRFVLDLVYPSPPCGQPDSRPPIVKDFHPYYHNFSQICLAFLVAWLVSLTCKTTTLPRIKLGGLTYWTRLEKTTNEQTEEQDIRDITHEVVVLGNNGTEAEISDIHKVDNKDQVDDTPLKPKLDATSNGRYDTSFVREIAICDGRKVENGLPGQTACDPPVLEGTFESKMKQLRQTKAWSRTVNVCAIVLVAVTLFLYVFFH